MERKVLSGSLVSHSTPHCGLQQLGVIIRRLQQGRTFLCPGATFGRSNGRLGVGVEPLQRLSDKERPGCRQAVVVVKGGCRSAAVTSRSSRRPSASSTAVSTSCGAARRRSETAKISSAAPKTSSTFAQSFRALRLSESNLTASLSIVEEGYSRTRMVSGLRLSCIMIKNGAACTRLHFLPFVLLLLSFTEDVNLRAVAVPMPYGQWQDGGIATFYGKLLGKETWSESMSVGHSGLTEGSLAIPISVNEKGSL